MPSAHLVNRSMQRQRIYISHIAREGDNVCFIELVTRRNLDVLRTGRIKPEAIPFTVEEIEGQFQLRRAQGTKKKHIAVEDTAPFQYFSEWKKANGF